MTGAEERFARRLADARAGHPSAWGELYDSLAPMVYSYLRSQSLDDPDDVAGETFLQVVRDIDRFEGTERRFRSWVLSIAHHRMLDARRARGRRPAQSMPTNQLPEDRSSDQAAEPVLDTAQWQSIDAVLEQLTLDQREVVVLRVVNELTLEETAQVLDRTVGSVKALQHRAFSALRTRISADRNSTSPGNAHPVWPSS